MRVYINKREEHAQLHGLIKFARMTHAFLKAHPREYLTYGLPNLLSVESNQWVKFNPGLVKPWVKFNLG